MISIGALVAFGLVSLGMVCSPGPNMIYLISRSITQGRLAGIVSLLGVVLGFVVYIVATMVGLTALGITQITISFLVNLLIVLTASRIAAWFGTRPTWLKIQRWLMAGVLTGLAVRLAVERQK